MSARKAFLTATLGIVAFLILFAWSPWNAWRYRGDGRFSDRGFFAYPRYVVTLVDIPLSESGERRFHLHGLPTEEMTLLLYVKGSSGSMEERPRLTRVPVTIEAELTDSRGRGVCHASGRPKDSNEDGIWVLTSAAEAAYWHWQCNHVQLHSNETYNLVIRVVSTGQAVEKVVVTPTFQGGGLELP